jgi:hypothetical protein
MKKMSEEKTKVPSFAKVLIGLAVVMVLLTGGLFLKGGASVDTSEFITQEQFNTGLTNLGSALSDKIDAIQVSTPAASTDNTSTEVPISSGSYTLTKGEFEDEAIEAKAIELATAYIQSKDFKKLLGGVKLDSDSDSEGEGVGLEDYEDITEIKVIDTEVTEGFKKDRSLVKFDLKVYFDVEGDEEDKAYIVIDSVTVKVDNLDFDEDFEDAEVEELDDSYYFKVSKLKSI